MSKSNRDKKEAIFKIFSQNLEWIKENPIIRFEPDFSNGYICPLCFNVFFAKDLDSNLENFLTLEDIPPKSLGGSPKALTCKDCNSKSGHELDVHLLNNLLDIDAHSFLPNSKSKAVFELSGNKVNGLIEVKEDGVVNLHLHTERSNPVDSKNFMSEFIPPKTIYNPIFHPEKVFDKGFKSPTFNLKFENKYTERRAEVALLRIAYLIGFSSLGNGFLINPGLYKVREQILKPDEKILPQVFWLKYKFPKEQEGINIISLPKELRSFLIIFSLVTKSKSRQFAIVLPGPSAPGIDVYDYIEKNLCVGDGSGSLTGFSEHINVDNFLKEKEFAFAANIFWQEYTDDNYEPRINPNNND
jgi:hypothetical protein